MKRLAPVDVLRALAVIAMVTWHTADGWLAPEFRSGTGWTALVTIGGLAAPLFVWLAGASVAIQYGSATPGHGSSLHRQIALRGAQLLVLDEPTASMDAEAEATVFERFQKLTDDQMVILISHRFSTVRMADHILVLENGRIQERGTHQSLIDSNGHYARLFSIQAAGYR
mgnify:CR=1 FL=1